MSCHQRGKQRACGLHAPSAEPARRAKEQQHAYSRALISFFAIAFGLSWGILARFIGFTAQAAVGVLPCLPAMLRAGAWAGRFFARSSSARQP